MKEIGHCENCKFYEKSPEPDYGSCKSTNNYIEFDDSYFYTNNAFDFDKYNNALLNGFATYSPHRTSGASVGRLFGCILWETNEQA